MNLTDWQYQELGHYVAKAMEIYKSKKDEVDPERVVQLIEQRFNNIKKDAGVKQ